MKESNIKVVEEIKRSKIEQLVYTSYFLGYMACNEGKLLSSPDCLKEIRNVIDLISAE